MKIPIAVGTQWREGDDIARVRSFSRIPYGFIYDVEMTGPDGSINRGVRFNLDPKDLKQCAVPCKEKE